MRGQSVCNVLLQGMQPALAAAGRLCKQPDSADTHAAAPSAVRGQSVCNVLLQGMQPALAAAGRLYKSIKSI